jgi:hypothetical protein
MLALFCASSIELVAQAQTNEEPVEQEEERPADVATVTVDGEDLFSVVGVSVRTGEERAEAVIERIIKVAEAGQDAPILRTQETEYGLGIYIDGTYIHTVSDVDVEYEGLDASPLANAIGDRIVEAILA